MTSKPRNNTDTLYQTNLSCNSLPACPGELVLFYPIKTLTLVPDKDIQYRPLQLETSVLERHRIKCQEKFLSLNIKKMTLHALSGNGKENTKLFNRFQRRIMPMVCEFIDNFTHLWSALARGWSLPRRIPFSEVIHPKKIEKDRVDSGNLFIRFWAQTGLFYLIWYHRPCCSIIGKSVGTCVKVMTHFLYVCTTKVHGVSLRCL